MSFQTAKSMSLATLPSDIMRTILHDEVETIDDKRLVCSGNEIHIYN